MGEAEGKIIDLGSRQRIKQQRRALVRQIDVARIKGQGSAVTLYEVLWQTEDVTSMVPAVAMRSRGARPLRLRLSFQDREIYLDEQRRNVAIGRAEDNDLVIKGDLISRIHARIEIDRNKVVLIDQSTNGTFVQGKDGEESFVRRDSLQIKGEGMIGLGQLPDGDSPQTIRFACEDG